VERFARIRRLIGQDKLDRLHAAHVTIVGLGAVGGYALEGLARAGIGHFSLIDFDLISPSNINRQILALESTVDRHKADVARERVLQINPSCAVDARILFVNHDTLDQVLTPVPDLLIDAIDALGPKLALLTECRKCGIEVISSMGAALRTDPSKVTVAPLAKTKHCPLARLVRKRLRKAGVDINFPCVYSTELVDNATLISPDEDAESDPHFHGKGRKRHILGSLPTLTGIFGLLLANTAISHFTSDSSPRHD